MVSRVSFASAVYYHTSSTLNIVMYNFEWQNLEAGPNKKITYWKISKKGQVSLITLFSVLYMSDKKAETFCVIYLHQECIHALPLWFIYLSSVYLFGFWISE